MTETTNITVMNTIGTLYFDGTCGFCRNGVRTIRKALETIPVSVKPFENGAEEPEMILELKDGRVLGGADAAIFLARRIPALTLPGWVFSLPLLSDLARLVYRRIAKNRHCLGPTGCALPTVEKPATGWLFTINLILAAVAVGVWFDLPAWIWMWLIAFATWVGFKLMSYRRVGGFVTTDPLFFLWPGMDPGPFEWGKATGRRVRIIPGMVFVCVGAILVFLIPTVENTVAKGWMGVAAMLCVLHFGFFDWLAALWNRMRYPVIPIMRAPWRARGLGEFWGKRWNLAFSDWARPFLFRPLTRKYGITIGTMAGFLASGMAHELVISLPAKGGFGLPTLYFLIQGAGLILEKRYRFDRHCLGRAWTWLAVLVPAPLLFHPPFMETVFNPMTNLLIKPWTL